MAVEYMQLTCDDGTEHVCHIEDIDGIYTTRRSNGDIVYCIRILTMGHYTTWEVTLASYNAVKAELLKVLP